MRVRLDKRLVSMVAALVGWIAVWLLLAAIYTPSLVSAADRLAHA